jgi:hypothetical protein
MWPGTNASRNWNGPVVDGQAQDAHVVGVHDAVAEAHGLPLRHHGRRARAHRLQQRGIGIAAKAGRCAAFRVEPVDDVVGQLRNSSMLVACREMLEMAEADEAGRHAGHHGGGFEPLRAAPARASR